MSKKQILAGNWKMNGTIQEAESFIENFLKQEFSTSNEVVICPPFSLLYLFKQKLQGSNIELGAQDCHFEQKGAFTGDISPAILKDIGCKYVILGHSERRAKHYETNYLINKKATAAYNNGLVAIICVGESETEKNEGKTKEVISKQIKFSLPKEFNASNTVIAYEPVWSIGTGNLPTSEEIISAISEIRKTIATISTEETANNVKIIYGGSVNDSNAKELLLLDGVDGALVGGASLKAESFASIVNNSKS